MTLDVTTDRKVKEGRDPTFLIIELNSAQDRRPGSTILTLAAAVLAGT